MKRRPQPTQAQSMGHVLTDAALLEMLLEKASLTQQQTEAFVGYSTQLAAGLYRLPKTVRDHAIAVAKASGLLQRTEMRRHPHAGHVNLGDGLSTVRTTGTEYAESLLKRFSERDKNGVLAIRPPSRRSA